MALMQTKGLFSAVMGQEDTPDELEQAVDGATARSILTWATFNLTSPGPILTSPGESGNTLPRTGT